MKKKETKPRKSLRTMLMLWLLMFAVVPLAFITGYSLVKYEQAIDQELIQRLKGNKREIQVILQEFYNDLSRRNQSHASDKSLIYYLTSGAIKSARELAMGWMEGHFTHRLSVFSREGRLEVALFRNSEGRITRQAHLEGADFYLSDRFVKEAEDKKQIAIVDFTSDGAVDLIMFSRILTAKGALVGYVEEILRIDQSFISGLKNRLNLELAFFSDNGERVVTSHDDFRHYRPGFFLEKFKENGDRLFELNIQSVPYGVTVQPLDWGGELFYIAIAASKRAAQDVLKNINVAFFTVVGAVVLLLIVLSFIFSKLMLQPLNDLVVRVQNIDFDHPPEALPTRAENELGQLTESFNEMAHRVYTAQKELKENIKKLEAANTEIKETQAKLVHAAKMASLGQLVAGVAHELNNPIGFIYSNMSHLRDYSQRLVDLVRVATDDPKKLSDEKERLEFDYVASDMPKLIKSCEEGARRTRDIVLGLRNFSRLEEAKLKEVNIHEGLDSTLSLLSGEFKSRIKVHKNYGSIPQIMCYPSQLNQVFMNILSNASHAIVDQGEIFITTRQPNSDTVEVSIRDTGVGMSEEVQERLFDPFFTTKDLSSGTGLGMSITYGIIKKHHGDIRVKSKPKEGTEFIITLPVHLDA